MTIFYIMVQPVLLQSGCEGSGKIDGDRVQISNSDSRSHNAHAKSYPDTVWRKDNNTMDTHLTIVWG